MTVTFLSAGYSLSVTVNSVCSSAGAAAAPPAAAGPAATATGAAAVTPNFFSMSAISSTTSMTLILAMASRISSFETAMIVSPEIRLRCQMAASGLLRPASDRARRRACAPASMASPPALPTSFWIGAFMTPISIASACSRVGRLATRSRSFGASSCPPSETAVGTSLSLSFAKALNTRAAAPGSSFEKASTSGPLSTGPMHSNDVPAMALRASVFLTTRMYTPAARAFERSSVICDTVSPRYSAATTDRRLRRHRS